MHVHQIGTVGGEGLWDASGETTRCYAPNGDEFVVIRPDGYVAARLPATAEAIIIDYLTALLPNHTRDT